jgi:hypothetical protein
MTVQLQRGEFSYDIYKVTRDSFFTAKAPRHEENFAPSRISGNENSSENRPAEIKFHRIDFDMIGFNRCPKTH